MSYILYFVSRTTISPTDGSVDRETGLDICKPGISGQAGPSGTLDVCESGYNGQTGLSSTKGPQATGQNCFYEPVFQIGLSCYYF